MSDARFDGRVMPQQLRMTRLPVRKHRALPHRRSQCPAWLVEAGMATIGGWVRTSRVRLGMTQAQLGRRAGVSQTTVSRLERGVLEGLALYRLAAIIGALETAARGELRGLIDW
jgi:DNA-binding XRE family transcriptional regulator